MTCTDDDLSREADQTGGSESLQGNQYMQPHECGWPRGPATFDAKPLDYLLDEIEAQLNPEKAQRIRVMERLRDFHLRKAEQGDKPIMNRWRAELNQREIDRLKSDFAK